MMNTQHIHQRAQLYQQIRTFFFKRNILEVETPLLCSHTVTDVHIDSFQVDNRYLQTSPEYCMKRLLAAGSGPIYQICKAFRLEEAGSRHNPEFTMLEWYRPGFNHHQLIGEVDMLLQTILNTAPLKKQSYQDCFKQFTNIDPFSMPLEILLKFIETHISSFLREDLDIDIDTALQIILSEYIEPQIGQDQPFCIYDFPPSQAALAKIRNDAPPVAERFEIYYKGYELANGFHELTDPTEQAKRFGADQAKRKQLEKHVPDIDLFFIDALKHKLPACAGVAIGLDRLLMVKNNKQNISDVLCFSWQSC